jgi:hypothetical protein
MTISQDDFALIAALDLDPIKVKLMHKESGEGWSLEQANAVEFEYRRFLYLMKKFPQEAVGPRSDVDIFWHYHILDTIKYARDCQAVFGYFLHHFPYIGLRGDDDLAAHGRIGERMRELYEGTFSEPFLRGPVAEKASRVASQFAYSYAMPALAESASSSTAYSYAVTAPAASASSSSTAYSYAVTAPAESASSIGTAYSYAVPAAAESASSNRTAYSYAVPATEGSAGPAWNEHAAAFSTVRPSLASVAAVH